VTAASGSAVRVTSTVTLMISDEQSNVVVTTA